MEPAQPSMLALLREQYRDKRSTIPPLSALPSSRVTGKTVLVTGANTGLGLEVVRSLMDSPTPYTILLGSRNIARGETATETLRKEYPDSRSTVEMIQIEMTDDDSITRAVETIENSHGRLDVLVNNAGLHHPGINTRNGGP